MRGQPALPEHNICFRCVTGEARATAVDRDNNAAVALAQQHVELLEALYSEHERTPAATQALRTAARLNLQQVVCPLVAQIVTDGACQARPQEVATQVDGTDTGGV